MAVEHTQSAPQSAAGPGTVDRRTMLLVFSTVALGMLLAALDQTIVSTALPSMVSDLGGAGHLSWVVSSYLLADTIAAVLAGKFGDQFGRKRVFQVAAATFVVASALCGLAQGMQWLIAWRAVQGFAAGLLMVTSMAVIADVIPLRERGKYQGALGAVFAVTTVIGPLLGGLFTDHLSWRWAFYVNVPIGIVVIVAAAFTMPNIRPGLHPVIDYLGIVFVSIGAAGLTLALSWGGTEYAWSSLTIIAMFIGSLVSLAIFVLVERRAADPILPLRLFRSSVFVVCVILILHRRIRHARRDHVLADLPAVRQWRVCHRLRPADPAIGRRLAGDVHGLRQCGGQDRSVQDLPGRRHGRHYARHVPAVPHRCGYSVLAAGRQGRGGV
jgi:EmrB/QacA subfamily drug resistance transporter